MTNYFFFGEEINAHAIDVKDALELLVQFVRDNEMDSTVASQAMASYIVSLCLKNGTSEEIFCDSLNQMYEGFMYIKKGKEN